MELGLYNANVDRQCSECEKPIKANTDYVGEYGDQYGFKKHIDCKKVKQNA